MDDAMTRGPACRNSCLLRPTWRHRLAVCSLLFATCALTPACQDKLAPGEPPTGNEGNELVPSEPSAAEPNEEVAAPPAEPNIVAPPVTGNPNVVAQPNAVTSPNVVGPTNPNLRFVGRMDTSDPKGPIMNWAGSKIIAGFSGTSVTLNLAAVDQQNYPGVGNVDNYVNVSIDGGPPDVLRIAQGVTSYAVGKKLAPGNHTLEVTKRTESQIGSLQYRGLVLDAGATLMPGPALRTRRLEFIGDSGSVGYGADGSWAANRCGYTPLTQNAPAAYSMVTGDLLRADVMLTGYSGKGLFQNRDPVNDAVLTLPVLWTMTSGDNFAQPKDQKAASWEPSAFVPDAVVVIVGGNDFAARVPSASAYNTVAVKFLRTLRSAYPNAWIFVAISPMLEAPDPSKNTQSVSEIGIQYAQAMVASVADPKVSYLRLTLDDGSRGVGCDYHMNVATHRVTAQAMASAIAAKLGWK